MEKIQSSAIVKSLRVGQYYNRKFKTKVLPQLASSVTKPFVYGHVKRVLELQGFETEPSVDNKSVYRPDDLFLALSRYLPQPETEVNKHVLAQAVEMAMSVFGSHGHKLIPMSLEAVGEVVKLDKSSGAPVYDHKREALDSDIKRARRITEWHRAPDPCTAFHRIQHGEKGPKVRLVWGYPLSMTLLEGRFAYPLTQKYLSLRIPMAFGSLKLGLGSRTLGIRNCNVVYGTDYSKFDSSVKPYLIKAAFSIIRSWFTMEWFKQIDQVEQYFIHTPIVMPDGYIYRKHTGVPSGSWFTQIVDSIVNFIVLQYAIIRTTGKPLSFRRLLLLGDDSIFGINHPIRLDQLAKHLAEVGITLNLTKTCVSGVDKPVEFLGHDWDKGLVHRRPQDLAKRMIYPETVDIKRQVSAIPRLSDYLPDAVECWPIIWTAYVSKYGIALVKRVNCIAREINVDSSTGYSRFIREEFRREKPLTAWSYVCTSVFR